MSWKFLLISFVAISARHIKRGAEYYTETIYISGNVRQFDPFVAYVEPNREVGNFDSHRRAGSSLSQKQNSRVLIGNINPQHETLDQSQQSFARVEPRHIHSQNYQNNFQINNDFQSFGHPEESHRVKHEENERDSKVQIDENNKRIDEMNQKINQQMLQNSKRFNDNQANNGRFDNKQHTNYTSTIGQDQKNTRSDDISINNQNNERQNNKHQNNRNSGDHLNSENNEGNSYVDVTQNNNMKLDDNQDSVREDTRNYNNQGRTNVNTNLNQNRSTNTHQDTNNHRHNININEPSVNQENSYNNVKLANNNVRIPEINRESTNTYKSLERTNNNADSADNNKEIISNNRGTNSDRERTNHNTGSTINKPAIGNNNGTQTNNNAGKTIHNVGRTNEELPFGSNQSPEDKWSWGTETTPSAVTPDFAITPDLDDRAAFNGGGCPNGKIKIKDMCVDKD